MPENFSDKKICKKIICEQRKYTLYTVWYKDMSYFVAQWYGQNIQLTSVSDNRICKHEKFDKQVLERKIKDIM